MTNNKKNIEPQNLISRKAKRYIIPISKTEYGIHKPYLYNQLPSRIEIMRHFNTFKKAVLGWRKDPSLWTDNNTMRTRLNKP